MENQKEDRYYSFSKKEEELMELFWDAGDPLSRSEILERAEARSCSWKPNSIHILLNALLKKGAVQVAGYYLSSRKLGRTFEPAITRRDYALMQVLHASKLAEQAGVPLKAQLAALKQDSVK